MSRVDALLTTRLHGMVLALKNGVPVVAIDAIRGGGKVTEQAHAIGWPEVFAVDTASDADLTAALGRCLAPAARKRARASAEAAACALDTLGAEFARALHAAPGRRSLPPDPYLKARRFWALFHEREMRFRAGRSKA